MKITKDKVVKKALCLACKLTDDNDSVSDDENDSDLSDSLQFLSQQHAD